MKRFLIVVSILISMTTFAYADEVAVPQMRPSAPDVKSEVPDNPSEYQNAPDVKNEEKPTEEIKTETADEESAEEEYEEEEDNEAETESSEPSAGEEESQSTDTNNEKTEKDSTNPINNDASKENVQTKNYVPNNQADDMKAIKQRMKEEKKILKERKKKKKKDKPKYGKYQDVQNDPYIQAWEEELKQKNAEDAEEQKTNVNAEQQEPQKTYTQDDYEQAYRDMEVPTFSFVHGMDPDQYYDMKDSTWSPYPLMRLNSPLYFKTIAIEPGYYLLTPRQYKDNWYILFKESGKVKYIIPAFDKSYTPSTYYRDNLKELDMTKSARWQIKFLNAWGKYIRKSKRRPAIQCNVELTDLDNNFLLLELYYGAHKYSTLFRIEKF